MAALLAITIQGPRFYLSVVTPAPRATLVSAPGQQRRKEFVEGAYQLLGSFGPAAHTSCLLAFLW